MKLFKNLTTLVALSVLVVNANQALADDTKTTTAQTQSTSQTADKDVATTVSANKKLSTLSSNLKKTGLDKKLSGKGPYTVFAPSDKAFSKLTPEQKKQLADKETLKKVLMHHVVANKALKSKDITSKSSVPSMAEEYLVLETNKAGDKVVGGALIKEQDIQCKNGVIHVIDEVIFPQTPDSKVASGKKAKDSVKNAEKTVKSSTDTKSETKTSK